MFQSLSVSTLLIALFPVTAALCVCVSFHTILASAFSADEYTNTIQHCLEECSLVDSA